MESDTAKTGQAGRFIVFLFEEHRMFTKRVYNKIINGRTPAVMTKIPGMPEERAAS